MLMETALDDDIEEEDDNALQRGQVATTVMALMVYMLNDDEPRKRKRIHCDLTNLYAYIY